MLCVIVLAVIGAVAGGDPVPPTASAVSQLHLAQGNDPTSMTVSWISPLKTSPTAASVVHYGTSPLALDTVSTGYAQYYTTNFPGLANYTSGLINHVTLAGLQPATQYFYVCGDASDSADNVARRPLTPSSPTSSVQSFTTLPAAGDAGTAPLTLGIIGDLGQTSDSAVTVQVRVSPPGRTFVSSSSRHLNPLASAAPGGVWRRDGAARRGPFIRRLRPGALGLIRRARGEPGQVEANPHAWKNGKAAYSCPRPGVPTPVRPLSDPFLHMSDPF